MRSTKLSRRGVLRGMALLAGGGLLAACGAPPAAEAPTATPAQAAGTLTTIVVMHQRNELSEDAERQFEAENPDIAIELVEGDAQAAASSAPDLMRVQAADVPHLLARDPLLDLTPFFESSSVLQPQDLAPANDYYRAASPTEIGKGKIYGMVKDWSPDLTLFANSEVFAAAGVPAPDPAEPLSYADLALLAPKLTTRTGERTTIWGYAYFDTMLDRTVMSLLQGAGGKLYADDFSSINLTANDGAEQLFRYFFDLAQAGATPSPLNPSASWPGEDFTKGNVALLQTGYWFNVMAESDTTRGKVVMLPAPTWQGQRRSPAVSATGMVVSKGTKAPEAAWRVFEWYNGGAIALERFSSGWGVPSLQSKYDLSPNRTAFQQQTAAVLREELKHAATAPIQFNPYLGAETFSTIYGKHLEAALRGQITFNELLQRVETEVNGAIEAGKRAIG